MRKCPGLLNPPGLTTMTRLFLRTLGVAGVLIAGVMLQPGQAQRETPKAKPPAYVLVPKSAKRIKAVLKFEVRTPNILAESWSLYVTQLPVLPGQVDVKTVITPRGIPARDLDGGRPMLVAQVMATDSQWRKGVSTRVDYEATLLERQLERLEPGAPEPPAVADLGPAERRQWLESSHQFDHRAASFQTWLDKYKLRREPGEDPVDFARKVFLVVRKEVKHYEGNDIEHLASNIGKVGKSDYAGITAVYIAALRANGIPARALGGRLIINQGRPMKDGWPHAKVEFFAAGIGWVPADIAGAIRSNRSPEGLECFGNDSAEFLTHHIDTDLLIETFLGRKTLEWLPDVTWWVKGTGSFDALQTKATMDVEVEPLDLAETLARLAPRPGVKKQVAKKRR